MGQNPLRILLRGQASTGSQEGPDTSYLEMLLSVHGGFQVLDNDDDGGHDAILLAASRPPNLGATSGNVPVIVLSSWRPDWGEVEAMVQDGAEDVLPLADLNGPRLEAAVRKAVMRRQRTLTSRVPLRAAQAEATAAGIPVSGIRSWDAFPTAGLELEA